MKQKRKVKSLISLKDESNVLLTVLLFLLGGILCFGAISLFTSSVGVEAAESEVAYEGIDDQVEVIFDLSISPENDLTNVVNDMYLTTGGTSQGTFHMSGNVINNSLASDYNLSGNVYLLGGENMNIASDNITIIGGRYNEVFEGNPNTAILGGDHNKIDKGYGKNAAALIGGDHNTIGKYQDSNAIIGGQNNEIKDNVVNSYILGGEGNKIYENLRNVIVGGKGVTVDGISNVFAFSDGRGFSPKSPNAFYLYVAKGLGLGIDTTYGGVESKGPVSFGEIGDVRCTDDNIGVQGSLSGCLVGCTQAGKLNGGKWELIDHGDYCENVCNSKDNCTVYVPEPEPKPSYTSKCTVGNVDTGHAFQCASNLLDNYKDVVFETYLIDSEGYCPNPDDIENKCAFMCEINHHLTGDTTGKGDGTKCYADCELPWGGILKHNETVTAYNAEEVNCSNDAYIFPENTSIVNVPTTEYTLGKTINGMVKAKVGNGAKEGHSYESCENYTHKKRLVCNNGTLYIAKTDNKKATDTVGLGSKATGKWYGYETCSMKTYKCNTGVGNYHLDRTKINQIDQSMSWNGTDRGQSTHGKRGVYELCLDWNAVAGNRTSCQKGAEHYKLVKCQNGYSTGDGYEYECKKRCDFDGKTDNNGYKHGTKITAYKEESVTCPGKCSAIELTCNDGIWEGGDANVYSQDNCVQDPKKCEGYDVSADLWSTHNNVDATYDDCEKLKGNGNKIEDCIYDSMAYKLKGCIGNRHHNDDRTFCESNTTQDWCDPTGISLGYGEKPDFQLVDIHWEGPWDTGDWEPRPKCGTTCADGYHPGAGGCEDNCDEEKCLGYNLNSKSECPEGRTCTSCQLKDEYCNLGAIKWKPDSCADGYHPGAGGCEEDTYSCIGSFSHAHEVNGIGNSTTDMNSTLFDSESAAGSTKCAWVCDDNWHKNGNSCEEDTTYTTCGGDVPALGSEGLMAGPSTYTAQYTQKQWAYKPSGITLGACEWTCDDDHVRDLNGCKDKPDDGCSGPCGSALNGSPLTCYQPGVKCSSTTTKAGVEGPKTCTNGSWYGGDFTHNDYTDLSPVLLSETCEGFTVTASERDPYGIYTECTKYSQNGSNNSCKSDGKMYKFDRCADNYELLNGECTPIYYECGLTINSCLGGVEPTGTGPAVNGEYDWYCGTRECGMCEDGTVPETLHNGECKKTTTITICPKVTYGTCSANSVKNCYRGNSLEGLGFEANEPLPKDIDIEVDLTYRYQDPDVGVTAEDGCSYLYDPVSAVYTISNGGTASNELFGHNDPFGSYNKVCVSSYGHKKYFDKSFDYNFSDTNSKTYSFTLNGQDYNLELNDVCGTTSNPITPEEEPECGSANGTYMMAAPTSYSERCGWGTYGNYQATSYGWDRRCTNPNNSSDYRECSANKCNGDTVVPISEVQHYQDDLNYSCSCSGSTCCCELQCPEGYDKVYYTPTHAECVGRVPISIMVVNPAGSNPALPGDWYIWNLHLWVQSGSTFVDAGLSSTSACRGYIGIAGAECVFDVPYNAMGKKAYFECNYDKSGAGFYYAVTSDQFLLGGGLAIPCPPVGS